MNKRYIPAPIDTSKVTLSTELLNLAEQLAENTHEVWAAERLRQGWNYGPQRDDAARQTPCLVPYKELSEAEKAFDRNTALETIRVLIKLGWTLISPEG